MILTVHTSPTYTVIDLPHSAAFAVNPARQQAQRISLAGSVIRQVSAFDASTARAAWSGPVDSSVAEQILTAYASSPFCSFNDERGYVYEAVWSPTVARLEGAGTKRAVTIAFDVIRKVY